MQLTAKTDYACKALLALSLHFPTKEPMQLEAISKQQKIPVKFLTQIMLVLKQLGYVKSTRGKCGGYLLAKDPNKINIGKLVKQMGTSDILPNTDSEQDVISHLWKEIDQILFDKLTSFTFDELANRQRSLNKAVMYEI